MNLGRRTKIEAVINRRQEGVVVLEDIHDPHNAAAVMRSCDALGVQKVYLIFEKEEGYDPGKVGKNSSSSANKWLSFKVFKSTKECLDELKKEGYEIVATTVDVEAKELQQTDLSARKIAIVMGNEHRGISETAKEMADKLVYIPMKGMVESFNVSVAAAIVLYELSRQRRQLGEEIYGLDWEEKKELLQKWS